MRVTTDFFVSALLRRVNGSGGMAVLGRKGASEAGAVFVKFRRPDRMFDLFGPAVQSAYDDEVTERAFQVYASAADEPEGDARLARERQWDPDLWIVEIETWRGSASDLILVLAD